MSAVTVDIHLAPVTIGISPPLRPVSISLGAVVGPAGPPGPSTDLSVIKGIAYHGADENYARPAGLGSVEWQGSVVPLNATDGDTYINTA